MTGETRVTELLERGNTREAATEALKWLGPKMLGYLHAVLRNEADAGDAFSVFAENLWKGLPTFRRESSLTVWAYQLAWNAAMNLVNAPWKRRGQRLDTTEAGRLADQLRRSSVVRFELQRRELEELRATLTPEEQTLLLLRIDQELSWEEVATVLREEGQPADPAAIRKRFERLKDRLAKLARERGLVT